MTGAELFARIVHANQCGRGQTFLHVHGRADRIARPPPRRRSVPGVVACRSMRQKVWRVLRESAAPTTKGWSAASGHIEVSRRPVGYWTGVPVAGVELDESAHGVRSMSLWAVLAPRRAVSSRTLTSRRRSATAGRQVRARESHPGAGHAATDIPVVLRRRPHRLARQRGRP